MDWLGNVGNWVVDVELYYVVVGVFIGVCYVDGCFYVVIVWYV